MPPSMYPHMTTVIILMPLLFLCFYLYFWNFKSIVKHWNFKGIFDFLCYMKNIRYCKTIPVLLRLFKEVLEILRFLKKYWKFPKFLVKTYWFIVKILIFLKCFIVFLFLKNVSNSYLISKKNNCNIIRFFKIFCRFLVFFEKFNKQIFRKSDKLQNILKNSNMLKNWLSNMNYRFFKNQ